MGEGLALLDEAMVAVVAGELSPAGRRHGVLLDDRRLPGDRRVAPRPGVDRRADGLVRASSQTWSPSPASAWSTGPRSCSCTGHGRRRSRRPSGRVSGSPRAPTDASPARPSTSRRRSTGSCGDFTAAEDAYRQASRWGLRAAAGAGPAAAGPGQDRGGRGGDPPGRGRDVRAVQAGQAAPRPRRDHACGRRPRRRHATPRTS